MTAPTDMTEIDGLDAELPEYEPPSLKVMEQDEVLEAFQMTATEIGAAGCWWTPC